MKSVKEFVTEHMNEVVTGKGKKKKVHPKGMLHLIQGLMMMGTKLERRVGLLENENIQLRQALEKAGSAIPVVRNLKEKTIAKEANS